MEGLGSLTLIVKAPNQRIEDQRVACDRTWTVKQLKEHLSAVHPDKPHRDEQKLVYFGKLLKDEASLQEVLTQESYEDAHTVHLVCPSQAFNETYKPHVPRYSVAQPTQGNELRRRRDESQTASESTQSPEQPASTFDGTQQWYSWAQMQPTSTAANQMTAQQLLWMRMYQQQMALYNYSTMQRYMYSQPAQPLVNVSTETAAPAPAAPEAAPPADAAQPAVNEEDDVVRMNAQGGVDAAEGQHDWMDTLYLLFRFSMLMLLLFFNTTLGRFAIVIAVGGFFYLAQGNMFRIYRRRRPVEQELPARPQPPQNEQNQAENQNNENNERDSVGGQSELNNNAAVEENISTWMDSVRLAITFIITFFTSIIPQNPAAALQN